MSRQPPSSCGTPLGGALLSPGCPRAARIRFHGHLSVSARDLLRASGRRSVRLERAQRPDQVAADNDPQQGDRKSAAAAPPARDSRRTVGGVEELALAGLDPTPSSVVAGKELLEHTRQRLSEERQLVELHGQGLSWEEVAASLGRPGRDGTSWPARSTGSPRSCDSTSHDSGATRDQTLARRPVSSVALSGRIAISDRPGDLS